MLCAVHSVPCERGELFENAFPPALSHIPARSSRTDKVLADPAPQVLVEEFGASVIKYTVRAWCKHEDYWDVHYGINDNVLGAFKDAGVKMSYEHVNVHMVQD